jgi:hypothetical protein
MGTFDGFHVWITNRITNDNCVIGIYQNDIPKRALPLSEAVDGSERSCTGRFGR